eukprot:COSAG06_NODE_29247_length_560_cov_0.707158_1_plen_127_part_10
MQLTRMRICRGTQGGWGKPPVDEFGRPLYGDVFGTQAAAQKTRAPIERTPWGELEEEESESSSEEEEDPAAEQRPDDPWFDLPWERKRLSAISSELRDAAAQSAEMTRILGREHGSWAQWRDMHCRP